MELNNIILKPHHTEKSYGIRKFQDPSCLVFVVNNNATKDLIKLAFKSIYNVMPEKVNIVNRKPKKLRLTNNGVGYSKWVKLAYITLPKGVQIALTRDEIEEASKTNKESAKAKTETKKEVKSVETKSVEKKEAPKKESKPTEKKAAPKKETKPAVKKEAKPAEKKKEEKATTKSSQKSTAVKKKK